MIKYTPLIIFIITLVSCNQPSAVNSGTNNYFDVKGFFENEARRLAQLNTLVLKTVMKDNRKETRKMRISNWQAELGLFMESDINKPAWKSSYKVSGDKKRLLYTATDSTLRTQRILIEKDSSGVIKHISVLNRNRNMLYESDDKLDYFTDSLYRIQKEQDVLILGNNTYEVTGNISK